MQNYPSPINLSYYWNMGFASLIFFFIQLLTGIFLAMHYTSDSSLAFNSVDHIMRDVNFGWFFRFLHANGASFFFIAVYFHIGRNLYYKRYEFSNHKVWNTGIVIFFLMMGIAFIGYVLPWGQMSFWGATVITSLVSALPFVGFFLVFWIWGGFSVSSPTLIRFFAIHYLLPFILFLLIILHFAYLHNKGSSNPSFIASTINKIYQFLYPYFVIKDILGFSVILFIFAYIVFFYPDYLGHSDNYIKANPLLTPEHIVPEWYFLPFYAILRSITIKLLGVLMMVLAILIFLSLPYIYYFAFLLNFFSFTLYPTYNSSVYIFFTFFFFSVFFILGWVGGKPAESPYILIGFIHLIFYFFSVVFIFSGFMGIFFFFIFYNNELFFFIGRVFRAVWD